MVRSQMSTAAAAHTVVGEAGLSENQLIVLTFSRVSILCFRSLFSVRSLWKVAPRIQGF